MQNTTVSRRLEIYVMVANIKVSKIKLGIATTLIYFICGFNSSYAFSQTQLPKTIHIGTRTAALALGTIDNDGSIGGFCGDVFEPGLVKELDRLYREGKIKVKIKVKNDIIGNQYADKNHPRYQGLLEEDPTKKRIEIECGPNSLSSGKLRYKNTPEHYEDKVTFSNTFYASGIKLLLKIDKARDLVNLSESQLKKEIKNLHIGSVRKTTTHEQLSKSGMGANAYSTREEVLKALDNGSAINAFATDALIVQTLLEEGIKNDGLEHSRPPYKINHFTIFPPEINKYLPEFKNESYAIVVKKDTPYREELIIIINDTLRKIDGGKYLGSAEKDYSKDYLIVSKSKQTNPGKPEGDSLTNILAVIGVVGIFVIAIIAIARGHIFHQHGKGDNFGGSRIDNMLDSPKNKSQQDEDS
jgi:Bacterial extracellular solute-binding proteins, family 3